MAGTVANWQQLGLGPKKAARAAAAPAAPAPSASSYQSDPYGAALGAQYAYNSPELAYNQQQGDLLRSRFGLNLANQSAQEQLLRAQTQDQLNDVNNRSGQIGIDIAGQQRLLPYYDQLSALADQMLASQMSQYGIAEKGAQLDANKAWSSVLSDATARGALTAPGTREQRGFIDQDLQNALGNIMENKNQATIGNTKEKLGYENSKANARDNIARLELEAQGLGMKAGSLRKQLEAGLQALGVSTMMNANDIMQALNSNNYQQMQLGRQMMMSALQYGSAATGG